MNLGEMLCVCAVVSIVMWKMLSKKVSVESLLSAFPCKHIKITIIILNVNLTSWGQAISKQSSFREGLCHES